MSTLKRIKILLFEDNPGDVRIFQEYLHEDNSISIDLENVDHLATGLEKLANDKPDIILLDLGLPDSLGLESFNQVQSKAPDVPIVILTGMNDSSIAVQAVKAGAQDYLIKGEINGSLLSRAIRHAIERKRTREKLIYQGWVLENISDILVSTDNDFRIISWNNAAERLYGWPESEVIGRSFGEIVPTQYPKEGREVVLQKFLKKGFWQGEVVQQNKMGEALNIFSSVSVLRDRNGLAIGSIAVNRDISERKQVQKSLDEMSLLNQTILETIPFAIDIVNKEGKVLFASPQFAELTGRSVVGELCWEMYKDDGRQCEDCPLKREERIEGVEKIEVNGILGNKTFEISHVPIDYKGEQAFLEVFNDITESKKRTQDIFHRLSQLETLYASSHALNQLLKPGEIGERVIEILSDRLNWHHVALRILNPETGRLDLLAFNQPNLQTEAERNQSRIQFETKISLPGEGLAGWALEHNQFVYSPNVSKDSRYVAVVPGIGSGIYIPLRANNRPIGCLSVESVEQNAFTESDEWLLTTIASQAASAIENARLMEEANNRLSHLETIKRVSISLRSSTNLVEMMEMILDEVLTTLETSAGAIYWMNHTGETMENAISRGWLTNFPNFSLLSETGILSQVYKDNEIYLSKDISDDPILQAEFNNQLPAGWGIACLSLNSQQRTHGVLLISVPTPRELSPDEMRFLNTIADTAGSAINSMHLTTETNRRLKNLQALQAVDQIITTTFDLQPILTTVINQAITQLEAISANVLVLHPTLKRLEYISIDGMTKKRKPSSKSEKYIWQAIHEQKVIHVSKPWEAGFKLAWGNALTEQSDVEYYAAPLISKGEANGVLELFVPAGLNPDAEWFHFLETLAGQTAIAMDSTQLFQNLQRSNQDLVLAYDATIEGWSRAMDLRDEETEGHTQRVTEHTIQMGLAMGMNETELLHMRRGALLHDIGKLGVPDQILLKPGPLTDDEWALMKRHPVFAYEMLLPIYYLRNSIDIPYCHHEKWDGTGYPRGLKGEEIPEAARVFAVADVWDALTSDRPYREAWEKKRALEHIREQSGKQFEPKVVEVFLALMRELLEEE